jgi:diguanylate cyclase (GGDEF)-like protein
MGCCDVNGDPWLSCADVLLARQDAAGALAMLEHPRRRLRATTSAWTGTRELRVRARALAATGQWEPAYRCMEDYVAAYEQARSVAGDRAAAESGAAVAVDDARRQAQHFEQLALTDPLTGLPNRRHAERWLAEHAGAEGGALCVAIADLDHFKRINDTHSHDAGDLVLMRFGAMLQHRFQGAGMLAARLGGEEFLLAMAGVPPEVALGRCQALCDQLRETSFADILGPMPVTVSIGLAHAPRPTAPGLLLPAADGALYAAKRAGRDRVVAAAVPDQPAAKAALLATSQSSKD